MNKITILAISATFAITILAVTAFEVVEAKPLSEVLVVNTEPIEVTGISSSPICPAENVQHWNKLVFTVNENQMAPSLPNINNGVVTEIVVQVDPDVPKSIRQLAFEKLDSLGYTDSSGNDIEIGNISNLVDFEYSTICAEN